MLLLVFSRSQEFESSGEMASPLLRLALEDISHIAHELASMFCSLFVLFCKTLLAQSCEPCCVIALAGRGALFQDPAVATSSFPTFLVV